MSEYYRGKRSRNIYSPIDEKPFKLSRSKIDLFLECPKCFYIDRRLGLGRPPGFPFALTDDIKVSKAQVLDTEYSDHLPILVEMEL